MTAIGHVKCRLDVRIRRLPRKGTPAQKRKTEERAAACVACEWFQASVSRCCFPRGICPRSPSRIEPWANMPWCPSGSWRGVSVVID